MWASEVEGVCCTIAARAMNFIGIHCQIKAYSGLVSCHCFKDFKGQSNSLPHHMSLKPRAFAARQDSQVSDLVTS